VAFGSRRFAFRHPTADEGARESCQRARTEYPDGRKAYCAYLLPSFVLLAGCGSLLGLDDFQAGEGGSNNATTSDATSSPQASIGSSTSDAS